MKSKIAKVLAVIVSLAGLTVAIGWIFFPAFLKIISPNLIVMRFTVSLCFVVAGIVLFSAGEENEESSVVSQMILPAAILLILLLMSPMLASSILGINTGVDNFFVQAEIGPVDEASFGRPPILVMVGFILIAVAGMLAFVGSKKHLAWMGAILILIGAVAMVGYAISQPLLYYSISGISSAMAFITAPLFIFIGVGLVLCEK